MRLRILSLVLAAAIPLVAQAPKKPWTVPRTPDGHPDLQGIWTNATLTPLERPAELANRPYFTEDEAAAYEKKRVQDTDVDKADDGSRGPADLARRAYNAAFFDRGTHIVKSRRTSLVVDPPDGRIPAFTPEAQKRFDQAKAYFAAHPADGPEDRNLSERCLVFSGVGPPMLPEPYNNNYQILQTPAHVVIQAEMNHTARIVLMGVNKPPLPTEIRQWAGDSRGHWDGDTLVVETTNVKFNDQSHFGVAYGAGMTDENLRVVERFTRTGPDVITYRATVEDATVYSRPWTIEMSMSAARGPLFEYACHEGNYGMSGILSGFRAQEGQR